MIKSIENNTLYAVVEKMQDVLGYIVLFQTDKTVECLILTPYDTIHDFIDIDSFFSLLDSNKIEKVDSLDKKMIKELKEKHCK